MRAVWNTLPYKLTNNMIVSLAYYACKMINMFPKVNNSGSISPRELFTEVCVDYKRDCRARVREYVKVIADNDDH